MDGQMSIFDVLGIKEEKTEEQKRMELIEGRIVKWGSPFSGGTVRIIHAIEDGKLDEQFLKREYGCGGGTFYEIGVIDFDAKGLSIREWHKDEKYKYTWAQMVQIWKKAYKEGTIPEKYIYEAGGIK